MRTLLREGIDRYEVLKADEPLRQGERPVLFNGPGAAESFLERAGGPGGADLRRLAHEDFRGDFSGVRDEDLVREMAGRIMEGRLKVAHVVSAPIRLRGNGAAFGVLVRGDRPRRGEASVRVWDETSAFRHARMLATLPARDRSRLLETAGKGAAHSQREQSWAFSQSLVSGRIRVVRLEAELRPGGGGGAPPDGGEVEAQGFGWRDAASLLVGFVPGISEANDLATVITGRDAITGETVGTLGKIAAVVGMVTPFSGGQIRAAGKLFRFRDHAIDQARKRGVSEQAIRDALENPLKKSSVKMDNQGRPSQTYMGKQATVSINPETDDIVTAWPTSTKRREKALRQKTSGGDADD